MTDNKLIAEFMGYEVKHGKCYSPKYNDGTIAPMQFDRSWDWLMPVVEKIEEIAIDDGHRNQYERLAVKEHRYQVDMGYTQCSIHDHVRHGVIASADMGTKLLSTHRAVIEFLKEYNNG
jgi:hypothetical protein